MRSNSARTASETETVFWVAIAVDSCDGDCAPVVYPNPNMGTGE
jgi:hypothetical protein